MERLPAATAVCKSCLLRLKRHFRKTTRVVVWQKLGDNTLPGLESCSPRGPKGSCSVACQVSGVALGRIVKVRMLRRMGPHRNRASKRAAG